MKLILYFSSNWLIAGVYRYRHLKPAVIITNICLLLLASNPVAGQAGRKNINFKNSWATGGSIGPSFPVGAFEKISHPGLHSSTGVEWYISGHFWLRGLFDFSTYVFESSFQQNDFVLQQNGNRTLIMVLADVGYRTQFGKWTPAVYVGNGLTYYTEPVLTTDFPNRRISVVRRTDFFYALHAGVMLEYELNSNFKPFFELSTTFFPNTPVTGNTTFIVLQPKLGLKVPLNGILNSVFKRENP